MYQSLSKDHLAQRLSRYSVASAWDPYYPRAELGCLSVDNRLEIRDSRSRREFSVPSAKTMSAKKR